MENEKFRPASFNWYPGHMAKTKRQILEDLKLIDVVVEILDARIPISSQNPDVKDYMKNKGKVVVLNKSDLADDTETQKWVRYFEKQGIKAIVTDSNSGKGINNFTKAVLDVSKECQEKFANKGRVGKAIRIMIVGIPNVGKSSFINRITKKNIAQVGNKPGVTRQKQWIRLQEGMELMDTPGVLWPKLESEEVGLNLAFTGTIKDDVLPQTEVAYELIKFLLQNYRTNLSERYNISNEHIEQVLSQDQPENFNIYEIMQEIGKKRGAIISGGQIDDEKTAKIVLEDFRSGKLGKITIEKIK